ncbi:MAG: hypothetical protein PHX54_14460, partial [Lentimicrobiaceae bacterium]|nr:hypothetical protein [Lentimicrobiaceae bacterium]
MRNKLVFCQAFGDIGYCNSIIGNTENYLVIITLPKVYDTIIDNGIFDISKTIILKYPRTFVEIIQFSKNFYE